MLQKHHHTHKDDDDSDNFRSQKLEKCKSPKAKGYDKSVCYTYHNQTADYRQALKTCAQAGGRMMELKDQPHLEYIRKIVERYWNQDANTLSIWTSPRPSPLKDNQCLLQGNSSSYSLAKVSCQDEQHTFFCEYLRANPCNAKKGWAHFNDYCYKIVTTGIPGQFFHHMEDARAACVKADSRANLASVHSYEENEFLRVLMINRIIAPQVANPECHNYWIGYQRLNFVDNGQPNQFTFTDGSDVSFVPTGAKILRMLWNHLKQLFEDGLYPWFGTRPDDAPYETREGLHESCTAIHGPSQTDNCDKLEWCGKWNDVVCNEIHDAAGAICKKPAKKSKGHHHHSHHDDYSGNEYI
ncbi:C-type lectin-like [Ditylenchus destructor]|nr:C-type lectin-like [Ditylenchus destructor]